MIAWINFLGSWMLMEGRNPWNHYYTNLGIRIELVRMYRFQDFAVAILEHWSLMDTPIKEQQMFQNVTNNIASSGHEITRPWMDILLKLLMAQISPSPVSMTLCSQLLSQQNQFMMAYTRLSTST